MPRSRRSTRRTRWWLWVGIGLSTSLVATVAVSLPAVFGGNSTGLGSLTDGLNVTVAVGQLLGAAGAFWLEWRKQKAGERADRHSAQTALRRIVADASYDELRRRGLPAKLPLPLRWRPWAAGGGHGEKFTGGLIQGGAPPRRAGGLVEAFGTLPNRRLAIVGD